MRAFASARSAGSRLGDLTVEEATPDALGAGDLDLCLFSVGTTASRDLVPLTAAGGALCVDKSSAFRLQEGVPLVVREVNGDRAHENDGIVANPNCCSIPLDGARVDQRRRRTPPCTRGHLPVGVRRRRYGDGRLRREPPEEHDLCMDWDFDGVEFDEEAKIRAETRKILELPDLNLSATCVRVPVLVGHAEAVWLETEEPLSRDARDLLGRRPDFGSTSSRHPQRQSASTTCSWAGYESTPRSRTDWRSSSHATTSARAQRSTQSRLQS